MKAGTREEDIDLARADFERTKARKEFWNKEYDRVKPLVESGEGLVIGIQQTAHKHDAAVQEELMAKAGLDRPALAGFRKEEVANTAAKLEASRQAAIIAGRQLQKGTLNAPFRGRVERRLVDPGACVNVFPWAACRSSSW